MSALFHKEKICGNDVDLHLCKSARITFTLHTQTHTHPHMHSVRKQKDLFVVHSACNCQWEYEDLASPLLNVNHTHMRAGLREPHSVYTVNSVHSPSEACSQEGRMYGCTVVKICELSTD